MRYTEHLVDQRSPEWYALRLGRFCGSRAADMLATIKSGEAAARRNLRLQIVLERLTGKAQERGYVSQAMQDGIEREADAVALYDAATGLCARPTGFLALNDVMAGCSPDGLVGDDGGLEVKCPIPATHLEFLRTGVIPEDYVKQIRHCLWVTGRNWWDYLSYNPEFPEPLCVRVARVKREQVDIPGYETAALKFLAEVDFDLMEIRKLLPAEAVA